VLLADKSTQDLGPSAHYESIINNSFLHNNKKIVDIFENNVTDVV